jgi:hypothetical protein
VIQSRAFCIIAASLLAGCGGVRDEYLPNDRMNGLEGDSLLELDFPGEGRPGSTRDRARIFISGHSLVDRPLPDYLETIGESLGTPVEWNRQYIVGSPIRARTGHGFRTGLNREGEHMDVLTEWRDPKTVSGAYDVLLITEQSGLLGSLLWHDTVRELRYYHDQFISANPAAATYFYTPWLGLIRKEDSSRWIAYERQASAVWECVVTRVNVSLALESRADRLIPVPAALALAELVALATSPEGIPGVSRESVRETVDLLYSDNAHVTHVGSYFVALVTYAAIFRRAPEVEPPPSLSLNTATALQRFAWRFVSEYYRNYKPADVRTCSRIARAFNAPYWEYFRDLRFARESNTAMAWIRGTRLKMEWAWLLSRQDSRNPFHFDPNTDSSYWLQR